MKHVEMAGTIAGGVLIAVAVAAALYGFVVFVAA